VKRDYRDAALDDATRALCDFAVRVTRAVHGIGQAEIDALRKHGWDDVQILDAVHVVGFFNYYNRLVDALGVEPEDFMPERGHGGE
jgi:uncharacterized peroxidase-related enzyme